MKRRNSLEVTADILQAAVGGTNKTNLVVKSNLNFDMIKKYLNNLTINNFLAINEDGRYVTTEKGIKFIEEYQSLIESIKPKKTE